MTPEVCRNLTVFSRAQYSLGRVTDHAEPLDPSVPSRSRGTPQPADGGRPTARDIHIGVAHTHIGTSRAANAPVLSVFKNNHGFLRIWFLTYTDLICFVSICQSVTFKGNVSCSYDLCDIPVSKKIDISGIYIHTI